MHEPIELQIKSKIHNEAVHTKNDWLIWIGIFQKIEPELNFNLQVRMESMW